MGGFRYNIVLGIAVGENGLHARFMVLEAIYDLVKILGVIWSTVANLVFLSTKTPKNVAGDR